MKDKKQANSTDQTASSQPKGNGRPGKDQPLDLTPGMVVKSRFDEKTIFAPGGDLDALDLSMEDVIEPVEETVAVRDARTVVIPPSEADIDDTLEADSGERFVDSEENTFEAPLLTPDPEARPGEADSAEVPEIDLPFLDRDHVTLVDPIDGRKGEENGPKDSNRTLTETPPASSDEAEFEGYQETIFDRDVSTVIAPISDDDDPGTVSDVEEDEVLDLDDAMIVQAEAAEPPSLPNSEDGPEADTTILDLGGRTLYRPKNPDTEDEAANPDDFDDDDEPIIDLGAETVVIPDRPTDAPPTEADAQADVDPDANTIIADPSISDAPPSETEPKEEILEPEPIPGGWNSGKPETVDRLEEPSEELFQAEDPDEPLLKEDPADRRADENFSSEEGLTALDLFDSFSEAEQWPDLTDPIGLIDVLGADTGHAEPRNDFLSRLEQGFSSENTSPEAEAFPAEKIPVESVLNASEPKPETPPTDPRTVEPEPAPDTPEKAEAPYESVQEGSGPEDFEGIDSGAFEEAEDSEFEPEGMASVSPEQLEAALERVIDRIFTERIEGILREVIEKTVSEEIQKLRGALLENIAVDDDL
ncbi:MAG: hypothetical protein ACLFQY_01540 [Desulfococcaceae bacterium]